MSSPRRSRDNPAQAIIGKMATWQVPLITITRNNWDLLSQITTRDVLGRYRGSYLGLTWSVLTPVFMLLVYTVIFSQVFRARWGVDSAGNNSPIDFALNLFAGLLVFNFFGECANRAPTLVISNPNYVTKIVFPLEILAEMCVASALFQTLVGTLILLIARAVFYGSLNATVLLLPLVWLPLALGCLGMVLLLAAAGVFIRDIGQVTTVCVNMLMFLSPVFYPPTAVPKGLQWLIGLNPLSSVMGHTRAILIDGEIPSMFAILLETVIAALFCEASFRIFKKLKPLFGDSM